MRVLFLQCLEASQLDGFSIRRGRQWSVFKDVSVICDQCDGLSNVYEFKAVA